MLTQITVFSDYNQFLLQDEDSSEKFLEFWTEKAIHDLIAIGSDVIGVRTRRVTKIPIELHVEDSEPPLNNNLDWTQITESDLNIPSGVLVVQSVTDYFPDAPRIRLKSGTYRVRIYYSVLPGSPPNETAEEHFRIEVWPVLNKRQDLVFVKRSN